jgi:hypothetical protein
VRVRVTDPKSMIFQEPWRSPIEGGKMAKLQRDRDRERQGKGVDSYQRERPGVDSVMISLCRLHISVQKPCHVHPLEG